MRIDVLTLFPEILSGYLGQSILCDAIERGQQAVLNVLTEYSDDEARADSRR